MQGSLDGKTLKVAGDVVDGSIDRTKPQMEFVITHKGKNLRSVTWRKDVLPDTFKDGSKAVVEGRLDPQECSSPAYRSQMRLEIRGRVRKREGPARNAGLRPVTLASPLLSSGFGARASCVHNIGKFVHRILGYLNRVPVRNCGTRILLAQSKFHNSRLGG